MKKYLILLVSLFLVTTGYSQFGARYEELEITLKSGELLNGFGRMNPKCIEYKDGNKKNKKTIYFAEIEKAKFSVYSGKNKSVKNELTLESIELKTDNPRKKEFLLAELICEKQKIKIYGVYSMAGGGPAMGPDIGGSVGFSSNKLNGTSYSSTYGDFYCLIKGESFSRLMYRITSFKSFKMMASECFKDCSELSEKIDNKEFTKKNIPEIAEFYDQKCK